MRFLFQHIFTVLILTLFMSACTPVFKSLNIEYPDCDDTRSAAIKEVYSTFKTMQGIDAVLHIDKDDLSSLVNKSFGHFSSRLSELNTGAFSKVSFGQPKLSLGAQEINSELEFSFQADGLKRKIYGHITAKHSVDVGRDQFILNTNFDEMVLDRAEDSNVLDKNEGNRHLLDVSLKSFMNALNMQMSNLPLNIPIDLNILKGLKAKDIFSAPDYRLHSAKPVNILTKMKVYIPYIYEGGVVLLGSSAVEKSKSSEHDDTGCLWMDFNNEIDLELRRSMGISLDELQEKTSYHISKSYLSQQMNVAFKNTDLRSINNSFLNIRDSDKVFSKEIYFSDEFTLPSCEDARQDCTNMLQNCQRECDVDYGTHKCMDCTILNNPFEKERCITKQESCKTREEFNLYACNKNVEKCIHENNEMRQACEIENISLFTRCREKKEQLLAQDDDILLARSELGLDIVNAYVVQKIRTMQFDQDMERLEILRDLHVSVDTRLNLDLKNNIANEINCSITMKEPLFTHSQSDHMGLKRELSLMAETLPDGQMLMKASSQPYVMKIQLKDTPYEHFLSNDGLELRCNLIGAPIASLTKETFLKAKDIPKELSAAVGKLELKFEAEELTFSISPVKLDTEIVLYPDMGSKSIAFSR